MKTIGVDEVGWGCIAGPLVVCAAYSPEENWPILKEWGVRDSKKVGNRSHYLRPEAMENKCEQLARRIEGPPAMASWAIVEIDAARIDELGPAQAKQEAFRRAVLLLVNRQQWDPSDVLIVVDGNSTIRGLPEVMKQQAIPKADDVIMPCSVASVLAKAFRDPKMRELHTIYPDYGFNTNKGYSTQEHIRSVLEYGILPGIHRECYVKTLVANHFERNAMGNWVRDIPAWIKEKGWLDGNKLRTLGKQRRESQAPSSKR